MIKNIRVEGLILSGPPFHILARKEDIAERAIVVGDPGRVVILKDLLDSPRIVNEHRGLLTVTGKYKGVPVTIATHGIGGPSSAIVFEELGMLGVKIFVRLGTAGGFLPELKIGKVVVASSAAHYPGGTIGQYIPSTCMANGAHPELTYRIMEELRKNDINFTLGPVLSSDAFYAEDPEFARKWARYGVVAVEMECATLFALGWMRGWKTACVLVISDNLLEMEKEPKFATTMDLKEVFNRIAKAVLDTIITIEP